MQQKNLLVWLSKTYPRQLAPQRKKIISAMCKAEQTEKPESMRAFMEAQFTADKGGVTSEVLDLLDNSDTAARSAKRIRALEEALVESRASQKRTFTA